MSKPKGACIHYIIVEKYVRLCLQLHSRWNLFPVWVWSFDIPTISVLSLHWGLEQIDGFRLVQGSRKGLSARRPHLENIWNHEIWGDLKGIWDKGDVRWIVFSRQILTMRFSKVPISVRLLVLYLRHRRGYNIRGLLQRRMCNVRVQKQEAILTMRGLKKHCPMPLPCHCHAMLQLRTEPQRNGLTRNCCRLPSPTTFQLSLWPLPNTHVPSEYEIKASRHLPLFRSLAWNSGSRKQLSRPFQVTSHQIVAAGIRNSRRPACPACPACPALLILIQIATFQAKATTHKKDHLNLL